MLTKIEMTKKMLKDGSKDFFNWTRKNYCPYCKRKIQPKTKFSILSLAVFGGIGFFVFGLFALGLEGLILGILFSLFLDCISPRQKVCPICGCKYDKLSYKK